MRLVKLASATLVIAAPVLLGGSPFAPGLAAPRTQEADAGYGPPVKGFASASGIILTEEGVIVVDTGQNASESRFIMRTVRKLTALPVRFVIDTEPHNDHTTGHFVFPQ